MEEPRSCASPDIPFLGPPVVGPPRGEPRSVARTNADFDIDSDDVFILHDSDDAPTVNGDEGNVVADSAGGSKDDAAPKSDDAPTANDDRDIDIGSAEDPRSDGSHVSSDSGSALESEQHLPLYALPSNDRLTNTPSPVRDADVPEPAHRHRLNRQPAGHDSRSSDEAFPVGDEASTGDKDVCYEGGNGSGDAVDGDADSNAGTTNQCVPDTREASTCTDP